MTTLLIAIIGIMVTLFIVIGVHEFGHFVVARLCGIKVLRFSMGFGKKLFSWHDKKGTEYVLGLFPFGGYIKMLDENEEPVPPEEHHLAYNRKPLLQKMAVIAAGPLANIILAFFLYWSLYVIGFTTPIPLIGEVIPGSIAERNHLKPHDEIVKIDGKQTATWTSVAIHLFLHVGDHDQLTLEIKPANSKKNKILSVDLSDWKVDDLRPDPLQSLGIIPSQLPGFLRKNQYGPLEAIPHAWQSIADIAKLNFIVLGKMLIGKVSLQGLGGPITIFETAGLAFLQGLLTFMGFLGFLSVSIGMINVLPIPGLDGGHILFQTIEAFRRKPLSIRFQNLMYRLGFIALILLIAQALINDIFRL